MKRILLIAAFIIPFIAFGQNGKLHVGSLGVTTDTAFYGVDVNNNIRIRGSNKLYFGGTGSGDGGAYITGTASTLSVSQELQTLLGIQNYGILYQKSNIYLLNKAENNYVTFASRNTAGSEAVYDLSNVGTITTTGTISVGNRVLPVTTNTGWVGEDAHRWEGIYAGTANFTGAITSSLATGTSPLTIASTTLVSNLNADLLDGQHGSYYSATSHVHPSIVNYVGVAVDADTLFADGEAKIFTTLIDASTNLFPTTNNANSILSISTHPTNYGQQLGFAGSGNIYTRRQAAGTWGDWYKMYTSANNGHGGGIDADKLDGQEGSYYQVAYAGLQDTLNNRYRRADTASVLLSRIRAGHDYSVINHTHSTYYPSANIDNGTSANQTLIWDGSKWDNSLTTELFDYTSGGVTYASTKYDGLAGMFYEINNTSYASELSLEIAGAPFITGAYSAGYGYRTFLPLFTDNGFVKTDSATGLLVIDTLTYYAEMPDVTIDTGAVSIQTAVQTQALNIGDSISYFDSTYMYKTRMTMTYGTSFEMPSDAFGHGNIVNSDGSVYARFRFNSDGVVILSSECTANVTTSASEDRFSISDNGSSVKIQNDTHEKTYFLIDISYAIKTW